MPVGLDRETGDKVAQLQQISQAHAHEFRVVRSFYDAVEEVERTRDRARAVAVAGATSFVAAGMKERHLILPIVAFGTFEGEVFSMFEIGAQAGVRLVFVGSQERFNSLPWVLANSIDKSGELCGCEAGF